MTNEEFAGTNDEFKVACLKVNLPREAFQMKHGSRVIEVSHRSLGLSRQAGKWRNKRGLAYKEGRT
jgi:hypothetical protein